MKRSYATLSLASLFFVAAPACVGAAPTDESPGDAAEPITAPPGSQSPQCSPVNLQNPRLGAVIAEPKVVAVSWSASTRFQGSIQSFYSTILASPYLDWLGEYDTPTQRIVRGSLAAAYPDPSPPTGAQPAPPGTVRGVVFTDGQVQQELQRLITGHLVPGNDGNTLYAVHLPQDVNVTTNPASPASGLTCWANFGYHASFPMPDHSIVYYSVIPDGDCYHQVTDAQALATVTSSASHELVEAITDPTGQSWTDADACSQGNEIGDICNGERTTVDGFTVQLQWSQRYGACIASACGPHDFRTDPANCGACGVICAGTCTNGRCSGAEVYIDVTSFDNTPASPGDTSFLQNPDPSPGSLYFLTGNRSPFGGFGSFDMHPTGVRFDPVAATWAVFNEDGALMNLSAGFNVLERPAASNVYVHRAGPANIARNWTYLDNVYANNNPGALLWVTQDGNPGNGALVRNPHNVGLVYDGSAARWAIFNQDGAPMPSGASFNVLVESGAYAPHYYVQQAAATGSTLTLDNPYTNGHPNAVFLVSSVWNPIANVGNNHPLGVQYQASTGKWAVVNEDLGPIQAGAIFDVWVLTGGY